MPTVTASAGGTASASQTVRPTPPTAQPTETPAPSVAFVLSSSEFADDDPIPTEFTCDGADRQPEVSWSGIPEGTAELALVMHDPDAGGFVHWVVAKIPPSATSLRPSELPVGAVNGLNDFGATGYDGPCPPSGNHTYLFTLFAVSAPLEIGERPTARAVRQAAQEATIGRAELRGDVPANALIAVPRVAGYVIPYGA